MQSKADYKICVKTFKCISYGCSLVDVCARVSVSVSVFAQSIQGAENSNIRREEKKKKTDEFSLYFVVVLKLIITTTVKPAHTFWILRDQIVVHECQTNKYFS